MPKLLIPCHIQFYRHGDRNPVQQNPGDKYGLSYWPEGWGELTTVSRAVFAHLSDVVFITCTILSWESNNNLPWGNGFDVDTAISSAVHSMLTTSTYNPRMWTVR